MEKLKIEKLVRDENGLVAGYELNSGGIVDVDQALHMAKNFELFDVVVVKDDDGNEKIEGLGFDINKLDNFT